MIHVEGMGWFGAVTALALERAGIEFTWSDIDSPTQAWKASTGIVYPAGDDRTERERLSWTRWWLSDDWLPDHTVRPVTYGFTHKAPPHGGKYEWARWSYVPEVKIAAKHAFAVDVQAIVVEARSRFAERRCEYVDPARSKIVAHGARRAVGWVWGWSRKVNLRWPGGVEADGMSLYGKVHRFGLCYAYPVGAQPGWWWAGSALVNERRPRERDGRELADYYERWRSDFARLYPGVDVVESGHEPIRQGWRPKPSESDPALLGLTDTRCVFPALWHSGVRWAPSLVEGAVQWATRVTSSTSSALQA